MVKNKNISNVIPEEDIKIYCDFAQGMTPLNLSKKYHKKKSDINDRIRRVKQNYSNEELELFVETEKKKSEIEAATEEREKMEDAVFEAYKNFTPIVTICKQNNISMPTMYQILYKKAGGKEIFMEKYARQKRQHDRAVEIKASVEPQHTIIRGVTEPTSNGIVRPLIKPKTQPSPPPAAKPIIKTVIPREKRERVSTNKLAGEIIKAVEEVTEPKEKVEAPTATSTDTGVNFGFGTVDIGEVKSIGYSPIYCELIAGRHYTANKISIFESSFTDDQILNFDYQRKVVEEFIENHVTFSKSGKSENKLVIYLTGNQAALISVINVCMEKGVPIEAMHYNSETKTYHSQPVLMPGISDSVEAGPWKKILGDRAKSLWFCGCNPQDLKTSDNLYAVVVQKFRNANNSTVIDYNSYIIVDDFSKLWEVYGKMVSHVNQINARLAKFVIFAKPLYYNQEYEAFTLAIGNNLAKSFNYVG